MATEDYKAEIEKRRENAAEKDRIEALGHELGGPMFPDARLRRVRQLTEEDLRLVLLRTNMASEIRQLIAHEIEERRTSGLVDALGKVEAATKEQIKVTKDLETKATRLSWVGIAVAVVVGFAPLLKFCGCAGR